MNGARMASGKGAGLRAAAGSRSARAEFVVVRRRWAREAAASLWFKPLLAMVGALALGVALSLLEVDEDSFLWPVVFHGDASDARQLLVVVTGTMITVTSLVFGLTVVTLQIAATQFSPRLLRTFLHDGGTQLVLSGFVGTVAYSLAGLYTVGTGAASIPRLGISVALALALVCVGLLVYFIGHITDAVRLDSIMYRVERDARRVLHSNHFVIVTGEEDPDPYYPRGSSVAAGEVSGAVSVAAPVDGYVQGVEAGLLLLAARKGLRIVVLPLVGYHVVRGQALARVTADDGSPLKPSTAAAVAAHIEIDPERRIEREFGLGLRQLVDITNRAMSTGQNDPYTATQAVHHLTSLLIDAARRGFPTAELRDPDGAIRVVVPVMNFQTHLKVVCGHIRQGGLERHPRVALELLRMLSSVTHAVVSPSRVDAVERELDAVLDDVRRQVPNRFDLEEVLAAGDEVRAEIGQRRRELG
ncbi:MAG TPA: DUF2254 domain-containing protein [Actinomycetes bacterium]|nr:DUF2254 domain-containing protein [Actinomycetes bacterium]